ncbi:hypothetical protein EJB05_34524, partial [Eragrostis curvula]
MTMAAFVITLVLSSLLAAGGGVSATSTQQCHEEDQAALLAVNAGLGSRTGSSRGAPTRGAATGTSVDCDNTTGRVVGLSVSQDGNLTGAIPGDALAGLAHLRSLELHHLPGLTGPIPDSLAQLGNLTQLTISHTGVSGSVPAFLSSLTQLAYLDLSYNSLTGAIPASLADLPNLAAVNLSRNHLDGPIPPLLFSNLVNISGDDVEQEQEQPQQLASLWLSHNNLSGGVPAEFAAVRFAYVDLSRNALAGDPSPALLKKTAALQGLEHLDLSRNGFQFSLTAVELPEKLGFLDLSHNAIRGRIPAAVTNLTDLQVLNLSFNKLCGQVPSGGVMTRFDATSFQHNKCLCALDLNLPRHLPPFAPTPNRKAKEREARLHKNMKTTTTILVLLCSFLCFATSEEDRCDPRDKAALLAIKAAFGNPNQLTSWTSNSSCCDWHHVDCDDSTGRVIGLSVVQDASLTAGTIPDEIAGLDHLESLDLRRLPGLSGPIPSRLPASLSSLTISRTAVSGPLPAFLGELAALTELDLSYNALSGAIPPSLAALPNLWSVDLRHNRLTGALPPLLFHNQHDDDDEDGDEEEAFYFLKNLRLSHNNLSGGIPAEWAAVQFGTVSLSRNALAGDASALFGRDKPLQLLDLSRNAFSFNLSEVDMPEQVGYVDLSHNDIFGGVPAQVAELADLHRFNVSYNRLCGQLPTTTMDASCFQHNTCLCGAPLGACNDKPLINN